MIITVTIKYFSFSFPYHHFVVLSSCAGILRNYSSTRILCSCWNIHPRDSESRMSKEWQIWNYYSSYYLITHGQPILLPLYLWWPCGQKIYINQPDHIPIRETKVLPWHELRWKRMPFLLRGYIKHTIRTQMNWVMHIAKKKGTQTVNGYDRYIIFLSNIWMQK